MNMSTWVYPHPLPHTTFLVQDVFPIGDTKSLEKVQKKVSVRWEKFNHLYCESLSLVTVSRRQSKVPFLDPTCLEFRPATWANTLARPISKYLQISGEYPPRRTSPAFIIRRHRMPRMPESVSSRERVLINSNQDSFGGNMVMIQPSYEVFKSVMMAICLILLVWMSVGW